MRLQKLAVMGGLIGIGLLGALAVQQVTQHEAPAGADLAVDREAYEAMLAAHPFATRAPMTREEVRAIPKKDRPDLAWEQDFLRTMDPATGEIPVERLFAANRIAEARQAEILARGGGPLVTEAWEERGPTNVAGRTRALMFDPNDPTGKKVWAGGVAGGLWYTDDITSAAATWTGVDDFWANLAVSTIAYDPSNPQVMYVGTGEGYNNFDALRGAGIFKSTDGGQTWDLLPSTTGTNVFYHTQRIAVHPTTGDVYAAVGASLRRSQDGGATWESVLAGKGFDVEVAADGTIYAGMLSRVYASPTGDSGSWTQLNNGTNGMPTAFTRVELATTPADPQVIYAVLESGGAVQGMYRTDNGGTTWTSIPRPNDVQYGPDFSRGQAWYDLSIAADPNDEDVVFVGGINLFKSSNGGASWTQISHWYGGFGFQNVHADQHNIAFKSGSSDEAVFSHDGGVSYTANATAAVPTLQSRNNGYNVTQFYAGAIAPEAGSNVMLAGSQDNGTQRYFFPGLSATVEVRGGDGGFTFIDQTNSNIAISSYVYNTYNKSTNAGLSFPTVLINDTNTGSFINPAAYDSREDILYSHRTASTLYRVLNVEGNHSTSVLTTDLASSSTHLRVSPYATAGTSTVYAGTSSGRIYRLENAHATPTITQLTAPPGVGAVSSIDFGGSEDRLLVTRSNYGIVSVWETRDGGATWVNKEGDLPDIPVRWALYWPGDPSRVILATEAGVWETMDFAAEAPEWTPAPGFPITRVDMLQYRASDGMVMAVTHGRGTFTAPFRGYSVANEPGAGEPEGTLPGTHALSVPSPNPFRDAARFTLSVASPQSVRVALYDLRGRRLRVLHEGALTPGTAHPFEVDGRDLPAGTYVVAVEGEQFRDQRRVTLVR